MIGISVIIPTYNRIDQTIKTIDLLLKSHQINQSFSLEIIVSDSSPDDNLKKQVTKKYSNNIVKYLRPTKPGIATNKNTGAKNATHPIIIFCDSDMEVESKTIINTINALKDNPTLAGVTGQVIWKNGPKIQSIDRPRKEDRMKKINNTIYLEAIYSRFFATYKQVFFNVNMYDEEVFNMRGEGSDLSIRYWTAGYPLGYDQSIIVHHVYDTEGGIIRGVPHPEWGVAKDLLLLAYKYNLTSDDNNFINVVKTNFDSLKDGHYQIIQGIIKHLDFIIEKKPIIDQQKKLYQPKYNFKFLEIFSNLSLFNQCINNSSQYLTTIRDQAFYE